MLERERESAAYITKLKIRFHVFLFWVASSAWATTSWWLDDPLCDQVLCEFISMLYSQGEKIWKARLTVLSVQTAHRHLRGNLPRAWDSIKSWQLKNPLNSRVPMTIDICRAFFGMSLALGLMAPEQASLYLCFSVLSRVAFHCMLRPVELLRLTAGDVRLPHSDYEPESAVLCLQDPKNKASLGRYQYVMVHDPGLIAWLAWLIACMPSHLTLWPSSRSKFAKLFFDLSSRLLVDHLGLTLGSFRAGGTTFLHLSGVAINILKFRGRWKTDSSMEVYIQEAMARLTLSRLPDTTLNTISSLARGSDLQWQSPPSQPWTAFFDRSQQVRGWEALRRMREKLSKSCC